MSLAERKYVRDLPPLPAPAAPIKEPPADKPAAYGTATIEEIACQVRVLRPTDSPPVLNRRTLATRDILEHLATLPGETWSDRWSLFDADTIGRPWRSVILPDATDGRQSSLTTGITALMILDVVRPSYRWMLGRKLTTYSQICELRDAEGMQLFRRQIEQMDLTPHYTRIAISTAGQIQAHTGKSIRQLTANDLVKMQHDLAEAAQAFRRGLSLLWRALHQLGWIQHESQHLPVRHRRKKQLTCEQLVAKYGVAEPHAGVLVEYLKHRRAGVDYVTLRGIALSLVKTFWKDIADHHPELTSFAIDRTIADAWKERVRYKLDGTPRTDHHSIFFAVRAFYLDVAQWSLHDSYWAQWAAPSPISQAETKGFTKVRKQRIAVAHQRTRNLTALLPRLVEQADQDRRATVANLNAATAAGHGGTVELAGEDWTVFKATSRSPIRARRGGLERNLADEEYGAFWAWAVVETLRHSGIRPEEMLELTHLAIQPYTVPASGETIPLLHIAPSKTDEERLLVASPELVHVLAQIIARGRGGQQNMPLSQRWDCYEKVLSQPLPHLFARPAAGEHKVMGMTTIANYLRRLAANADLTIGGEPVHFTPVDFRRIFATEALSSGLPAHIVQVLMGHKSISTTQGYAAIYPQDVIRHHRTFITQRRKLRPSEEYRQPTAAEWEEFEAHFVTRKVSLGSCGRAYGTNCHHEHACVRCALLRPDPTQIERLREIAANLRERITEAHDQGWLGEVEGLQISLTGAELKLQQMEQLRKHAEGPVQLGLPSLLRPPNL